MKSATRWSLLLLGQTCVVLGTLGIFLPLLPTTPFILLAAGLLPTVLILRMTTLREEAPEGLRQQ